MTNDHRHPLIELLLYRFRSYAREPEAIFWTYGFPILLTLLLGIAFRNKPIEAIRVAIVEGPHASQIAEALAGTQCDAPFKVDIVTPEDAKRRLTIGKADIVVMAEGASDYTYRFDPTRPQSFAARTRVDDALQRAAGRVDVAKVHDYHVTEPGSRYVDFLIPGLIGMNLMGGGLFGVGFVTVDMRVRKLLKRLIATPMKRSHFLWSMVGGRMLFTIPELIAVLAVAIAMFGVPVNGSYLSLLIVTIVGGLCFSGIGLLIACRAQRLETISGLMNFVMLPMWLLSGIFFSTENFPDIMQPVVQALPLTQLINALRAVMLDGLSLASQALPLAYLLALGTACYALALKWFRWT